MFRKYPELMAWSQTYSCISWMVFMSLILSIYNMMKSSMSAREDGVRRRVSKRKDGSSMVLDQGIKKSIEIGEAFEQEKAMAQNYRQKNERNIVKCKYLYSKLISLGNLEGVPEMMGSQICEVDAKIKQIEQLLYFKRSQQMKKLRKKVQSFLQQINFIVQAEDLQKIEDEIQIILFLIDIFEEKFNQMTAERKEINEIIARLEKDSQVHNSQDVQPLKRQNEQLHVKINSLQMELEKLKYEERSLPNVPRYHTPANNDSNNLLEQALSAKTFEIERHLKKIGDLELQLRDVKTKFKLIEADLERIKRQELKLKQRYRLMEAQKDERIKLLEQSNKMKI